MTRVVRSNRVTTVGDCLEGLTGANFGAARRIVAATGHREPDDAFTHCF
jgi:hypothetical protein